MLLRKVGAPGNPEYAVGSIDETGWTYIAENAGRAGAEERYLQDQKRAQLQLMGARRAAYTPSRSPVDPKGRLVIVVDDGLATGASMIAALHAVRAKEPRWLIRAVPVAAPEALERVRPYADELDCLLAPPDFQAVGQFFREFNQVEDDEVIALLAADT